MNISETSEIVFGKMKVESVVDERLHLAEISVSARNYFFDDPVTHHFSACELTELINFLQLDLERLENSEE